MLGDYLPDDLGRILQRVQAEMKHGPRRSVYESLVNSLQHGPDTHLLPIGEVSKLICEQDRELARIHQSRLWLCIELALRWTLHYSTCISTTLLSEQQQQACLVLRRGCSGRFIRLKREQHGDIAAAANEIVEGNLLEELRKARQAHAQTVEENDQLRQEIRDSDAQLGRLHGSHRNETAFLRQIAGQLKKALQDSQQDNAGLQFLLHEQQEQAPDLQRAMVSLKSARDIAIAEAVRMKTELTEYDQYLAAQAARIRELAMCVLGQSRSTPTSKVSSAREREIRKPRPSAARLAAKMISDDILYKRQSAWNTEKKELQSQIDAAKEFEDKLSDQGLLCLCSANVKRCKLVCGHSLCTSCASRVDACPYCRQPKQVANVFEP